MLQMEKLCASGIVHPAPVRLDPRRRSTEPALPVNGDYLEFHDSGQGIQFLLSLAAAGRSALAPEQQLTIRHEAPEGALYIGELNALDQGRRFRVGKYYLSKGG